jgi:DNA polymerase (family 10)
MNNIELAGILYEMADIFEMQEVAWKPIAYRNAARQIEKMPEEAALIYSRGGLKALEEIAGVGKHIAAKIEELLKTGKLDAYEKLKRQIPSGVEQMMKITGVGPKKAVRLNKELGITSVEQLERAAKQGKIRVLEGFGAKSEQEMLKGIEMFRRGKERMLLGEALPIAREIVAKLKKINGVTAAEVGGSTRRRKETVADLDILVISGNSKKVMDFFTTMPDVANVLAKGPTKSTVMLKEGIQADVRVLPEKSFGAALQYFTGNKDHNILLRQMAIKKGLKLSEYGIFKRSGGYIAGRTEQEVYKKLGLPYFEPELRENTGELEAAKAGKLPEVIDYNALKGDLHIHTEWSDGTASTGAMVAAAQKIGYEYIAITDHSKSEKIANGLDEKRLLKHIIAIDKLNLQLEKQGTKFRIFKGSECDILANGKLDYSDSTLKKLDFVIGSVHSRFKSPKDEMTARICKALSNKYINILGHPTGRLINSREPYAVELEKVYETAVENGKLLEINSFPTRLDLKDSDIKMAKGFGAKFAINTDSHGIHQLKFAEYGIAQARRGWLEAKDVVNTLPLKKFEKFIGK